jgi:hypothetical protein
MKFTTTRLKHLSLLFLPALIWLFTNATINTHTHILNNGIRISHAHPFEKNNTKPNQYPGHNHTKNELILLDLISHPLTLLTFAFVAFILSYRNNIFPFLSIVQHSIKEHYFVFNYHAPPTTWV